MRPKGGLPIVLGNSLGECVPNIDEIIRKSYYSSGETIDLAVRHGGRGDQSPIIPGHVDRVSLTGIAHGVVTGQVVTAKCFLESHRVVVRQLLEDAPERRSLDNPFDAVANQRRARRRGHVASRRLIGGEVRQDNARGGAAVSYNIAN